MGAILDILPRCIDIKDENRCTVKGVFSTQLGFVIGASAYDKVGHVNAKFIQAEDVGP